MDFVKQASLELRSNLLADELEYEILKEAAGNPFASVQAVTPAAKKGVKKLTPSKPVGTGRALSMGKRRQY